MRKATDKVSGLPRTLLDGKEFDSSYSRGTPASFPVQRCHTAGRALQLMKEGAKWKLFIPSSLPMGEQGARRDRPPMPRCCSKGTAQGPSDR